MKKVRSFQFAVGVLLVLSGVALLYLVATLVLPGWYNPAVVGLCLLVLGLEVMISLFSQWPVLKKLALAYPLLEKERNSLLEYIEAIWKSHQKFIQQEKMDALNTLVGGIAHEINTPLGSAITAISFLEDLVKDTGRLEVEGTKVKEILDLAMRNLRKASALVVNFKKISAQKVEGEDEVQSVRSLLTYLINLNHTRAVNSGISVVLDCRKELFFNISFSSFSVIIDNVLQNAFDHAFAPGATGEVSIGVDSEGNDLKITIADNGQGMAPEVARQIFNPFYTTDRRSGHFGLGLPIAYNLAFRQFNGEIRCESELGKGTRFLITLTDILTPDPDNCLAV